MMMMLTLKTRYLEIKQGVCFGYRWCPITIKTDDNDIRNAAACCCYCYWWWRWWWWPWRRCVGMYFGCDARITIQIGNDISSAAASYNVAAADNIDWWRWLVVTESTWNQELCNFSHRSTTLNVYLWHPLEIINEIQRENVIETIWNNFIVTMRWSALGFWWTWFSLFFYLLEMRQAWQTRFAEATSSFYNRMGPVNVHFLNFTKSTNHYVGWKRGIPT